MSPIDLITAAASLCSHLQKKNPIHKVNLGQVWMLRWWLHPPPSPGEPRRAGAGWWGSLE